MKQDCILVFADGTHRLGVAVKAFDNLKVGEYTLYFSPLRKKLVKAVKRNDDTYKKLWILDDPLTEEDKLLSLLYDLETLYEEANSPWS